MMNKHVVAFYCIASVALLLTATAGYAGPLPIAGSPEYFSFAATGFRTAGINVAPGACVNNNGTAIGNGSKYIYDTWYGDRAVRWDVSGTAATELGHIGTDVYGRTFALAFAVNDCGTAVGNAQKFKSGGYSESYNGSRPVRWDATATAATELDNLGTDSAGFTQGTAYAINGAGMAVGFVSKYASGDDKGYRAVRWDAGGTAATELGNLGTNFFGRASAMAYAVNSAGRAVGYADKFESIIPYGRRAVRWDASGTVATELGHIGTDSNGFTEAEAYAVNDAGTTVGYAMKIEGDDYKGERAVRWDASGTAASELGNLGTDASGCTEARAYAVNASGTAVGYADKYENGSYKSYRAVRWDASGTHATELGEPQNTVVASSEAYAVNDAGTAVGYAYTGSDERAVIWLPDASAIDLNDLGVVPQSGGGSWTLTMARGLSPDGYVAGEGRFDPDGTGPTPSYTRLWVSQVGLGGSWKTAAGGTWGRGPNWSTGTPAMQVGDAKFDLNAEYVVALDRDERTKTITTTAGTVTLAFNGHTLTVENGMTIAGGATVKGAGSIVADIANSGTLAPGTSPGVLNITGDLANTGTLEFEIASLVSHDAIHVSDAFSAGGTIAVKLLDGYMPAAGDAFSLMSFGTFTNNGYAFDLSGAALRPGLTWDTTQFATSGSISVVPEPGSTVLLGITAIALLGWQFRRRDRKDR